MLVGELPAEIGDAARLGWVEVELEPLMAGAEVVDLEAPMAFVAFISEFPSVQLDPVLEISVMKRFPAPGQAMVVLPTGGTLGMPMLWTAWMSNDGIA